MEPGDEALLKEGVVDFISFSYYSSRCITVDKTLLGDADGNAVFICISFLTDGNCILTVAHTLQTNCNGTLTIGIRTIAERQRIYLPCIALLAQSDCRLP